MLSLETHKILKLINFKENLHAQSNSFSILSILNRWNGFAKEQNVRLSIDKAKIKIY